MHLITRLEGPWYGCGELSLHAAFLCIWLFHSLTFSGAFDVRSCSGGGTIRPGLGGKLFKPKDHIVRREGHYLGRCHLNQEDCRLHRPLIIILHYGIYGGNIVQGLHYCGRPLDLFVLGRPNAFCTSQTVDVSPTTHGPPPLHPHRLVIRLSALSHQMLSLSCGLDAKATDHLIQPEGLGNFPSGLLLESKSAKADTSH